MALKKSELYSYDEAKGRTGRDLSLYEVMGALLSLIEQPGNGSSGHFKKHNADNLQSP